jgi:uncharacterized protein YcaQ
MLTHQNLLPPRRLRAKKGILKFIGKVGCIQFDPLNVVGRNPDLVLQSRVANYQSNWLQELLYKERVLWDGWDKVMSIFNIADWPNFSRYRKYVDGRYDDPTDPTTETIPEILEAIRQRGPLSSIDFKDSGRVDWWWGTQASLAKSALDILYSSGKVGVDHKIGTRRVFDLIERLMPKDLLSAADPNQSDEDYQNWHVLRRVGGLGLAQAGPSEFWGGILGVSRTNQRAKILYKLLDMGQLVKVHIRELEGRTFYIRSSDMETLDSTKRKSRAGSRAAIIGALDNLLWDRKLVSWLFDFDYVWEVYKPAAKREYGYYVLPILYGDRFIGRVEPIFNRKSGELLIKGWWWEDGVVVNDVIKEALLECFADFQSFTGAEKIRIGEQPKGIKGLDWISSL